MRQSVTDKDGNCTSETVDGQTITATFNAANQLTGRGPLARDYDRAGNLKAGSDGSAFRL